MPNGVNILVVDDDPQILALIKEILEPEGYNLTFALNGETALKEFRQHTPALVLLDILLPGMDGYAVFKSIRASSQVPVIMVSCKDKNEERVEGLNMGADDYITKPFYPLELEARVKAMLRRSRLQEVKAPVVFEYRNLKIDFSGRLTMVNGKEVTLTATEYEILALLARNANRVIPHAEILSAIWGEDSADNTHLLQVNIGRIRAKLKDADGFNYIEARPGVGYILKTQE